MDGRAPSLMVVEEKGLGLQSSLYKVGKEGENAAFLLTSAAHVRLDFTFHLSFTKEWVAEATNLCTSLNQDVAV
ncbi:hypothetical protein PanWU01x14_354810 [Parasponia andersonii]|uniref:Uncharacterized protein n=1 Tax=Parasponia andersonii TaxID=3476 RepID=A0A2P5A9H1_PARAD|nr:hypothetical protein PanWU01x14_354810 [Parasponia andersonii]